MNEYRRVTFATLDPDGGLWFPSRSTGEGSFLKTRSPFDALSWESDALMGVWFERLSDSLRTQLSRREFVRVELTAAVAATTPIGLLDSDRDMLDRAERAKPAKLPHRQPAPPPFDGGRPTTATKAKGR